MHSCTGKNPTGYCDLEAGVGYTVMRLSVEVAIITGLDITRGTLIMMILHKTLKQVHQISLPERLEHVSGRSEKISLHPKKSRMKRILRIIRIIFT
jgi:hypothetical protein